MCKEKQSTAMLRKAGDLCLWKSSSSPEALVLRAFLYTTLSYPRSLADRASLTSLLPLLGLALAAHYSLTISPD